MKTNLKHLSLLILIWAVFFTGCTPQQTDQFLSDNNQSDNIVEYTRISNSTTNTLELHDKDQGVKDSFNIGMPIDLKVTASTNEDTSNQFSYDERNVILTTSAIADKFAIGNVDPLVLKLISDDLFFLGKIGFEDITSSPKVFTKRFVVPKKLKRLYDADNNKKYKLVLFSNDGGEMSNFLTSSEFSLSGTTQGEVELREFKTGIAGKNFSVLSAQYSELYEALKPYIDQKGLDPNGKLAELSSDDNVTYCSSGHVATTFRFEQYSYKYSDIKYTPKVQFKIAGNWEDAQLPTNQTFTSEYISGDDHSEKLETLNVCVKEDKLSKLFDAYIDALDQNKVTIKIPTRIWMKAEGKKENTTSYEDLNEVNIETELEVAFTVPDGFNTRAYREKTPVVQSSSYLRTLRATGINRVGELDSAAWDKKLGLDFAGLGMSVKYDSKYSDTDVKANTHVYANLEHRIYAYAGGGDFTLHRRHYTTSSYPNDIRKNTFSIDGFSPFGGLAYTNRFSGCQYGSNYSNDDNPCAFKKLQLDDHIFLELSYGNDNDQNVGKFDFDFNLASSIEQNYFRAIQYNSNGEFTAIDSTYKLSVSPKIPEIKKEVKKVEKKLGKGTKTLAAIPIKYKVGVTFYIGSNLEATNIGSIVLDGDFLYAKAAVWAKAGVSVDAKIAEIYVGVFGELELVKVSLGHELSIIYKMEKDDHFKLLVSSVYSGLNINAINAKLGIELEVKANLGIIEPSVSYTFHFVETDDYLFKKKIPFLESRSGLSFTYGTNTITRESNPVYNFMGLKSTDVEFEHDKQILSNNGKFKLIFDSTSKSLKVIEVASGAEITDIFGNISNVKKIVFGKEGTLEAHIKSSGLSGALGGTDIARLECGGDDSSSYVVALQDDGRLQIYNGTESQLDLIKCDSMVFNAENLVTIMSSSDTNRAYAKSEHDVNTWGAWRAFNGQVEDAAWHSKASSSETLPQYLVYVFDEPTIVNAYKIFARNNNDGISQAPKYWIFKGSNDRETWYDLHKVNSYSNRQEKWQPAAGRAYSFGNSTPYKYYSLHITGNNGAQSNSKYYTSVSELELYNIDNVSSIAVSNKVNKSNILSSHTVSTASATSSHNTGYWGPWRAFDGKVEDAAWHSNTADSLPQSLTYKFDEPTIINSYTLYARSHSGAMTQVPKKWSLEGSNDEQTWVPLDSQSNQTDWNVKEGRQYSFNSSKAYKYYKLTVSESNGANSYTSISELILQNNGEVYKTLDKATSSSADATTNQGSDYWAPWRAFDGNVDDTAWHSNTANSLPQSLVYKFDKETLVNGYILYARNNSAAVSQVPKEWTFEGSNDQSNWVELHKITEETDWRAGEGREFSFYSNVAYKYYRLNVKQSNGANSYTSIAELKLLQKNSIRTTTNTIHLGEKINSFHKLVSNNGRFELRIQNVGKDGYDRLVIYQKDINDFVWVNHDYFSHSDWTFNPKPNVDSEFYGVLGDDGVFRIYKGSQLDSQADTLDTSYPYNEVGVEITNTKGSTLTLRKGQTLHSNNLEYFMQIGTKGEFNIYKYSTIPSSDGNGSLWDGENKYELVSSFNPEITGFESYTIADGRTKYTQKSYDTYITDATYTHTLSKYMFNEYTYGESIELKMSDEGYFEIVSSSGKIIFRSQNYFTGKNRNRIDKRDNIYKGDYLVSENGKYKFGLDENGSLNLYDNVSGKVLWGAFVQGNNDISTLHVEKYGNDIRLKVNGFTGDSILNTSTSYGSTNQYLELQNNGNLALYEDNTLVKELEIGSSDSVSILSNDERLSSIQKVYSPNGRYTFGFLYTNVNSSKKTIVGIYDSKTDTIFKNFLELDGVVHGSIYFGNNGPYIQASSSKYITEISNFSNYQYKSLEVTDEGDLVVYGLKDISSNSQLLWSSSEIKVRYLFDGDLNDNVGNVNGSKRGDWDYTGGVFGSAVKLDDASDYVQLQESNGAAQFYVKPQYSFSVWVKSNSDKKKAIVSFGSQYDWASKTAIFFDKDCSSVSFYDGNVNKDRNISAAVECGKWNHIVATLDKVVENASNFGSSATTKYYMKLYINGELKATQEGKDRGTPYYADVFHLGKSSYISDADSSIIVDDLRVYEQALDLDGVKRIYDYGKVYVEGDAGMAIHYKLDGDTKDSAGSKSGNSYGELGYEDGVDGKAASLDGVDDYVELPSITMGSEYTITTWVNNSNSTQSWARIIGLGNGEWKNNIFLAYPYSGCSQIRFYDKDANNVILDTPANQITCGKWHHVAVSMDNTGLAKLYVDGELKVQKQGTTRTATKLDSNYIGKSNWSADSLSNMKIDDVRIFDKTLSDDAIKSIYNNSKPD